MPATTWTTPRTTPKPNSSNKPVVPALPDTGAGPTIGDSRNAQAHEGCSPRRVVLTPEGAPGQPGHVVVRARSHQDDRAQGAGTAALRGEAHHPRQEGHAAQPA